MQIKHLIIGRTCSGKSTVETKAVELLSEHPGKISTLKSYTTRPKRNDQDTHHIFINDTEVKNYDDQMIAYTEINGYKYFATKSQLEEATLYTIDPNGLDDLLKNTTDYIYIIHYIPVSKQTAKKRYLKRANTTEDEFEKRWIAEKKQFSAFEKKLKTNIYTNHPNIKCIITYPTTCSTTNIADNIITQIDIYFSMQTFEKLPSFIKIKNLPPIDTDLKFNEINLYDYYHIDLEQVTDSTNTIDEMLMWVCEYTYNKIITNKKRTKYYFVAARKIITKLLDQITSQIEQDNNDHTPDAVMETDMTNTPIDIKKLLTRRFSGQFDLQFTDSIPSDRLFDLKLKLPLELKLYLDEQDIKTLQQTLTTHTLQQIFNHISNQKEEED